MSKKDNGKTSLNITLSDEEHIALKRLAEDNCKGNRSKMVGILAIRASMNPHALSLTALDNEISVTTPSFQETSVNTEMSARLADQLPADWSSAGSLDASDLAKRMTALERRVAALEERSRQETLSNNDSQAQP